MAFAYKIDEHGFFKTSFRWQHTIWQTVVSSVGFWFFFGIHLLLWISFNNDLLELAGSEIKLDQGILEIDWTNVKIVSALTTFVQVFYTRECYSRYLKLNHEVNQSFRSSNRFCFEFKHCCCPNNDIQLMPFLRLAMRYMRANIVLFYIDLKHGALDDQHWQLIVAANLLREDEAMFLKRHMPPQRSFLLLDWISTVTARAHDLSSLKTKGPVRNLLNSIQTFDEAQKTVLDLVRMPVPYQYFHLLNFMLFVTVTMWAYGMAMTSSIFGPITYFFASFLFIGMLELAKQFSDPFGDDEVDFPVHIWIDKFLENQLSFIEYDFEPQKDGFESRAAEEFQVQFKPGIITSIAGPKAARPLVPDLFPNLEKEQKEMMTMQDWHKEQMLKNSSALQKAGVLLPMTQNNGYTLIQNSQYLDDDD